MVASVTTVFLIAWTLLCIGTLILEWRSNDPFTRAGMIAIAVIGAFVAFGAL